MIIMIQMAYINGLKSQGWSKFGYTVCPLVFEFSICYSFLQFAGVHFDVRFSSSLRVELSNRF